MKRDEILCSKYKWKVYLHEEDGRESGRGGMSVF